MQFQKGKEKTGGRTKGTPNRTNTAHRERLSALSDFFEETLKDDIKSLPPAERIKTWLAVQPYLAPKLSAERVDKEQNKEPIKMEITRRVIYKAVTDAEI